MLSAGTTSERASLLRPSLAAGHVLCGRYELISARRGRLFEAHDLVEDRELALDVWTADEADWAEHGEYLRRLGDVEHPSLVPLLDFGHLPTFC